MNLLNKIKTIFNKKTQINTDVSCLSSYIPLIDRKSLDDSSLIIKALDNSKTEYLSVLASNKTLVSAYFGNNNIYEEIKMYQTLIMNLLDNEESEISFDMLDMHAGKEELEYLIKMRKLKIYIEQIKLIWENVLIKLSALKEIKLEKVFLSRNKRQALKEEINNLESLYLILENLVTGLTKEIESYKTNYSLLESDESILEEDLNDLKKKKRRELEIMMNLVLTDKLKVIKTVSEDNLAISLMETELEKYVHTHKYKVEELKDEVAKFDYFIIDETKDELLEKINNLELEFKIYCKYGKNLITKEDIKELYKLKFSILTMDINTQHDGDMTKKATFTEVECYEDIIFKKIKKFVNEHALSPHYLQILKNGKNEYSWWDILNNHVLLSFLLVNDDKNFYAGMSNFFDKTLVNLKEYENLTDFHKNFFIWNSIVPIGSIYQMMYLNKETKTDPMYDLYKFIKKSKLKENKIYFPEGIKVMCKNVIFRLSFGIIKIDEHPETIKNRCFNLDLNSNNTDIIMPSTLEAIDTSPIKNRSSYECNMILNEGLKSIYKIHFLGNKFGKFVIPSTLMCIDGFVGTIYAEEVYFNNLTKEQFNKIGREFAKAFFITKGYPFANRGLSQIQPTFNFLKIKSEDKTILINQEDLIFEGNSKSIPNMLNDCDAQKAYEILEKEIQRKLDIKSKYKIKIKKL